MGKYRQYDDHEPFKEEILGYLRSGESYQTIVDKLNRPDGLQTDWQVLRVRVKKWDSSLIKPYPSFESLKEEICLERAQGKTYKAIAEKFSLKEGLVRSRVKVWDPVLWNDTKRGTAHLLRSGHQQSEDDVLLSSLESAMDGSVNKAALSSDHAVQEGLEISGFLDSSDLSLLGEPLFSVQAKDNGSSRESTFWSSKIDPTGPTSILQEAVLDLDSGILETSLRKAEGVNPTQALQQSRGTKRKRGRSASPGIPASKSNPLVPHVDQWWDAPSTRAPVPVFTADRNQIRTSLFQYQELRRRVFDVLKRSRVLRNAIWTSQAAPSARVSMKSADLQKLFLLQSTESESLQLLSSSKFEPTILIKVDELLSMSKSQATYEATSVETDQKPNKQPLESFPTDEAPVFNLSQCHKSLPELESFLSENSGAVLKEIDEKHFLLSLHRLQKIEERLPCFQDLSQMPAYFLSSTSLRAPPRLRPFWMPNGVLLHDNVFYAGTLFKIMRKKGSLHEQSRLDRIWAQLLAIIALCHGCTSEPAFFLSTLDHLLALMRDALGCDPSLYADTGSGKKIVLKKRPNSDGIAEYEVHMGNTQAKSVPADNQLRRLLMAEFALFIHGSAIYAIMHSASVFTMPEINGWQTWWSSLLKWKDECAVCGKKLTSPSGNLQDPWKISVGMRDKRSGKYTSESRVADERHTVYLCFSRMLTSLGNGWSHGLGPVFFYFAELYHADCRFAREKERALVLFQDMMPHEEEL